MFTFLQGHRTYLCAAAAGVVVFLQVTNHLSQADANTILVLLGFSGLAALRSGIDNAK